MPRKKKETVFPDHIRVSEPQKEALGLLVERAIGKERSLTEFAEACGVSPSTISRIINGKFATPISDRTILAIAENADPNSGVSIEDLLVVHGLAPISIETDKGPINHPNSLGCSEDKKIDAALLVDQSGSMTSAAIQTPLYQEAFDSVRANRDVCEDYFSPWFGIRSFKVHYDTAKVEKLVEAASVWANDKNDALILAARNRIQNLLVEHGYSIQLHKDYNISTLPQFRYRTNFAFTTNAVAEYGLDKWAFEVLIDDKYTAVQKLSWIFGTAYLDSPYKAGIKISLVIFDKEEFELVKAKFVGITIQDCVSVILMNQKNCEIIEEYQITQAGVERLPSVLINA